MAVRALIASLTIHYLAFSMALDYSIVLLSIEELWTALGGNFTLFGFVFGIYAFSQAIITPILGYISDLRGLKFTLILSMVVNALGNILYGFSFIMDSVNMILVGRFVSGLGAGSVALGVVYLTNVTSREMRGKSIASFKLSQAFGFFGGPVIGLAFTTLKAPKSTSNSTTKTFNLYTLPAWLALANVLVIVVPAVKYCFKNPLAPHMALRYNHKEAKELIFHTAVFMPLLFIASLCYWMVTSDIFTLAFGQYHLVRSNQDLWKVYVSAGSTLIVVCVIIRLTIHRREKKTPVYFTTLGLLLSVVGFGLLGDFKLKNSTITRAFYYGAVGLITSGGALFFTGAGTYYSRKVTDLSHQARNRRGLYLGLFTFSESFGRFIGPTLSSIVVHIKQNSSFKTLHKCDLINLIPDGCHVSNINVTIIVLCCVMLILTACFLRYHRRYGKCQVDVSLLSLEELPMPQPGEEFHGREISVGRQSKLELHLDIDRSRSNTDDLSIKSDRSNSINNNFSF